jgi:hypothetical protein
MIAEEACAKSLALSIAKNVVESFSSSNPRTYAFPGSKPTANFVESPFK